MSLFRLSQQFPIGARVSYTNEYTNDVRDNLTVVRAVSMRDDPNIDYVGVAVGSAFKAFGDSEFIATITDDGKYNGYMPETLTIEAPLPREPRPEVVSLDLKFPVGTLTNKGVVVRASERGDYNTWDFCSQGGAYHRLTADGDIKYEWGPFVAVESAEFGVKGYCESALSKVELVSIPLTVIPTITEADAQAREHRAQQRGYAEGYDKALDHIGEARENLEKRLAAALNRATDVERRIADAHRKGYTGGHEAGRKSAFAASTRAVDEAANAG